MSIFGKSLFDYAADQKLFSTYLPEVEVEHHRNVPVKDPLGEDKPHWVPIGKKKGRLKPLRQAQGEITEKIVEMKVWDFTMDPYPKDSPPESRVLAQDRLVWVDGSAGEMIFSVVTSDHAKGVNLSVNVRLERVS
jgi:hypothetical protein